MIGAAGLPTVKNITLPVANTEYIIEIPKATKKILLQPRNQCTLKLAFKAGESSTNYFTLKYFSNYFEDMISGPFTIAIQSDENNTIVELITWCHYD